MLSAAVMVVGFVTPTYAIRLLPTGATCLVSRLIIKAIGEGVRVIDERGAASRCAERDIVVTSSVEGGFVDGHTTYGVE